MKLKDVPDVELQELALNSEDSLDVVAQMECSKTETLVIDVIQNVELVKTLLKTVLNVLKKEISFQLVNV
jgi:hypothetical protein